MFNIPELARLRKESEKAVSGIHTPLWSYLSSNEVIDGAANFKPPPINLKDKTSTSLRLLLSDTQGSLEGFSVQVMGLSKDVALAKRQVEEAGKIVEDSQLRATEETKLLLSKIQNKVSKSLENVQQGTKELMSTIKEQHNVILIKQDDIRQVGVSLTQQVGISVQQQKELADEQAKKVEQLLEIQQAQSKDLRQVQELVLSQNLTLTSQETSIQSLANQIQALKETVEGLAKETPRTTAPNLNTVPFNPVPCTQPPIQTRQLIIDLPSSSPTQGLGRKPSTSPTGEWDGHRQSSFIERLAITPRSARMGWHIHNQLKNANSSSMTAAPDAPSHVDNGIRSIDGFSDLIQGRFSSPFAPSSPTPAPVALATNLQISYPSPASFKRPFDIMDPNSAQISSAIISSSDLIVQKLAPRHTKLTPSRPSRIFSLPTSQHSAETSSEHQHLEPIRATRLDTFAYDGNSAVKRQLPEPTPGQGQIRKKFKRTILQD